MEKRDLRRVKRPEATGDMMRLAEQADQMNYIVSSEIIEVSGEKILLLNFFKRSRLLKGETGAQFRTFISTTDYITQDLTTASTKWKKGSLQNMLGWYWWKAYGPKHDAQLVSLSDHQNIRSYLERYLNGASDTWDAVERFQSAVMERKLAERHKKETDKIDQKMEMVPEIPRDFKLWAHDEAMRDKRYLIYKFTEKSKHTAAYCTCCRSWMSIDIPKILPKNKKKGICPSCKEEVTFIPEGYFPAAKYDQKWVCLIQKVETGIVARYFHITQKIEGRNYSENYNIVELFRAFYEGKGKRLHIDSYEWGVYKQRGACRWCPDQDKVKRANAVLYTKNLPDAWMDSEYKYCALNIFQERAGCKETPIWEYMKEYPSNRFLEMFIKAGLTNLTREVVNNGFYRINSKGKTPEEILKLPRNYIPILREINGTYSELTELRQCAKDGVVPKAKDIEEYDFRFRDSGSLIHEVNGHTTIQKFIRYMDKQVEIETDRPQSQICRLGYIPHKKLTKTEKKQELYRNMAKDWMDYLKWCRDLKYDMNDPYVFLPPDLRKAHDRVFEEYRIYKDKMKNRRKQKIMREAGKVLEAAKYMPAVGMKAKGLFILCPNNAEEIKAEGRSLHHCVGSYVERVAKGETMILFIRKEKEPDTPFYTLEYRDGKVAQCRGKNNCSMTDEVKAFVEAFERKMQEEQETGSHKCG